MVILSYRLSRCCGAPMRILRSMPGGFVSQNCVECGQRELVSPEDIRERICPSCFDSVSRLALMSVHINGLGNYAYFCDLCGLTEQVSELVPHYTEFVPGRWNRASVI